MAFNGWFPFLVTSNGHQELRALWKNGIGKSLRLSHRLQTRNRGHCLGEKAMQRDIESKIRRLYLISFYLHLQPPAANQRSIADRSYLLQQVAYHNEEFR